MVTNSTYKNYSRQIAKLFCKEDSNKVLCEASIEERLNTFLDDYTYPYFLSKLNQGRQYITNLEEFKHKGFRIVLIDLITGERVTAWWEIPYNYPYLSKLPGKLLSHNFNIISANKTFNETNKSDIRITWNPLKTTYGITFVPQQVPGYTPPGITPPVNTPPGIITPIPVQPEQTPLNTDFSFDELFSNPIILIGSAIVLFLLIKDKF